MENLTTEEKQWIATALLNQAHTMRVDAHLLRNRGNRADADRLCSQALMCERLALQFDK